MTRFLHHLRSNLVAYLALFVALGGTSYAAFRLPAGSVGNRQLKNHSITPIKFAPSQIAGYVRDWATISAAGKIVASRPRAHLVRWSDEPNTIPGGLVTWGHSIPTNCFAEATTSKLDPVPAYASASISSAGKKNGRFVGAYVSLSAPQTGVDVAVICPQP